MKTIGVIANTLKPDATAVLQRLENISKKLGLSLVASGDSLDLLSSAASVPEEELGKVADVVLAFGGDGTMLRAVRSLSGVDTPVMGVNLGSLGFMTSVPQDQLEHAMNVLVEGTYSISDRSIAECSVSNDGKLVASYRALNDMVLGWGISARVVTISLSIDGEEVTSYVCDGVVVATPTGSTGHSLSAGGPVLHPETQALIISVICPHSLSHRPLVIPDASVIKLRVVDTPKKLLLSVDGQEEQEIEQGAEIEVSRSKQGVRFIHPPEYSYFDVLQHKLGWRGSSV